MLAGFSFSFKDKNKLTNFFLKKKSFKKTYENTHGFISELVHALA